MRADEDLKRCLGYLVSKTKQGKSLVEHCEGTAFFVSIPSSLPQKRYYYLVTAKHVLLDQKGQRLPELYLRLNTTSGGRDDIKLDHDWVFHKNPDVDIAILPITPLDNKDFEWRNCPYNPPHSQQIPDNIFADNARIAAWGIGSGDDLYITGLFSKRTGNKRNIPIVRSGIIAAMPEEPLEVEVLRNGKRITASFNAYLVEVRSIGGLSGSPVFAEIENFRGPQKTGLHPLARRHFLLGLIRGHWDYTKQASYSTTIGKGRDYEQVNMGMALVTPIQDVLDTLYEEGGDLLVARMKDDEATWPDNVISEDSGKKAQARMMI